MLGEESSIFPKQIKLDDYGEFGQGNVIRLLESSNLLVGSGARTSTASIVLAKTLHFLVQEKVLDLKGMSVLELGCGAGLLGVYLGALGADVIMADVPSVRDQATRNINLNKSIIKGRVQFVTANWKREGCVGKCQKMSGQSSTSSEQREECLFHLLPKVGLTIVCEGGGLADFEHQMKLMGKEGMIVCFLEREYNSPQDYLSGRNFQLFLIERNINYQKIQDMHPDYQDDRVRIYRLFTK